MRVADASTDRSGLSSWHLVAAIGAWLLPGLGHCLLGERRRAAILAVSIGGLWLGGLLIGGIGVINHEHAADPSKFNLWFLGQMLTAPSVAVDLIREHALELDSDPNRSQAAAVYEPSHGRVYEQGVLFTALAGLLNLLACMDVLYRDRVRRGDDKVPAQVATGDQR